MLFVDDVEIVLDGAFGGVEVMGDLGSGPLLCVGLAEQLDYFVTAFCGF